MTSTTTTTVRTTLTRGSVLLLPPDAACSVERQIWLGGQLGAVVLVVIGTDGKADIIPAVSSATAYTFTTRYDKPVVTPSPLEFVHGEETEQRVEGNPRTDYDYGSEELKLHGDGGQGGESPLRRNINGGDESRSVKQEGEGGACPPLTVVVGHEEGKRMLEWVRMAHGERGGPSDGGGRGGGEVTARLAERDYVGKLWRDVVWASNPVNWPKGVRNPSIL